MISNIETYHSPWLTYHGRMANLLGEAINDLNLVNGPILDWGCSYGISTREIAELFGEKFAVVGLEFFWQRLLYPQPSDLMILQSMNGENLLELLGKDLPVSFVGGDGYEPPFAPATFELIVMSNNIAELLKKGRLSLAETATILSKNLDKLQKNGTLLIGTNSGPVKLLVHIGQDENTFVVTKKINIPGEEATQQDILEAEYVADQIQQALVLSQQ